MARKVQITKEIILQVALDMLIRDGYSSINIKTLANEIGCSTQPIVWHFDHMEGLRTALAEYAWSYAKNKMNSDGTGSRMNSNATGNKMNSDGVGSKREVDDTKTELSDLNAVEAFEYVGRAFVEIAVNEPNLFRFLYLDENKGKSVNSFGAITASKKNAEMIKQIAMYLGIPEVNVGRYLQNTIIYAFGVASLVATNVITASEEEMMEMINRAADGFLMQEGVLADKLPQ